MYVTAAAPYPALHPKTAAWRDNIMDKVARAELEGELAELRREIRELQDEQAQLNKHAPGSEGNRHAFITSQLQILRDTEAELAKPLLDAMEDDTRDAPP
jgi:hypothetical protein